MHVLMQIKFALFLERGFLEFALDTFGKLLMAPFRDEILQARYVLLPQIHPFRIFYELFWARSVFCAHCHFDSVVLLWRCELR